MNVSKMPSWETNYAHPCAWEMDFAPLSLVDLFSATAARVPDAPAADFLGRRYSYRELHRQARAFAAGLIARGLARGDRVGLYLPNVPTYIAAYYGTMMAGGTVVNMSPLYTVAELEAQVADSGTRFMVTVNSSALLPTAFEVLRRSALEKLVVASLPAMLPRIKGWAMRLFKVADLTPVPRQDDVIAWDDMLVDGPLPDIAIDPLTDLALLQYTGGTTGTPKGAMLTHQNLSVNARQLRVIDVHRDDRDVVLGALPLFHVFANTCILNRTMLNGGMIAMLPRFDARQVLATVNRVKPTSMFGVPTMLQALLDCPDIASTDFSSVRALISGGAPLGAPLEERFEAVTGVRVLEGYGLTESSGVVSSSPLHEGDVPGTIGQPVPGTRIRLLDKEDPARDAPPGEPGELAVQGPQIMQGYWRRPEDAASAFAERDGQRWLRTGDVATIDEAGFMRIVDRTKDMISVGGFKVFPSQVEHVLLENEGVREALVIGVPNPYRGEVPRAYVTLMDGCALSPQALCDWLNARVGKHERVDRVVVREALPKTMIGKLDRKALRAEVSAE